MRRDISESFTAVRMYSTRSLERKMAFAYTYALEDLKSASEVH